MAAKRIYKNETMKVWNLKIPPSLKETLEDLAKKDGRPLANFVRHHLEQVVKRSGKKR